MKDGEAVDYGFSGVVDGNEPGVMHVELSQRDLAGRNLWSTSFDATVPTEARGVKPHELIYKREFGISADFAAVSHRAWSRFTPPFVKSASAGPL